MLFDDYTDNRHELSGRTPLIKSNTNHPQRNHRPSSLMKVMVILMMISCSPFSNSSDIESINLDIISLNQPAVFSLSQFSAYTHDTDGTQSLEDIIKSDNWKMSEHKYLNFGFSNSAIWLASKVQTNHSSPAWYLRIQYALFDDIQIYLCPEQHPISTTHCEKKFLGDQYPFNQRDIEYPEFISKLPIFNSNIYNLFIRFKTQGSSPLMIQIEDERNLQNDLLINAAIRGGYITMMLVMGLYNLFLYFSTRSRSYLYYASFVLTFMLFHATYAGSAFQFLWPGNPELNLFALPFIFSLNMVALTLFVPKFLNLRTYGKKSFYLFRFYLVICIFFTCISFIAPYQITMKLLNILNMIFTISALVISARFWLLGNVAARFFTIAWLAFIVGLLLATSRSLGLIPLTMLSYNSYQLGSFIEIILLSLALGERITQLQKEKIESKKALFESQEEAIHNLKRYEDLYQNSLTGQFQLNEAKFFIKSNPAWLNIIGVNEQQIESHTFNFNQCFQHAADAKQFWALLDNEDEIKGSTLELITLNSNKPIYVNISIRRGQDSAWIASAQDISEEFEHEQAIKQLQSEKNRSLRQLVMGVSHEMNTPLGNIRMAQTFLDDHIPKLENESKTTFTDGLDIIKQGSDRLQELGQLMKSSVASNQVFEQEDINIHNWFEQWKINQSEQNLLDELHIQIDQGIEHWNTYPDALEKILNQLVKNSITHNPKQYESKKLYINISLAFENKKLLIQYYDNGSGIAEENRDNIFQPFYTTQRQQATQKGLGLYHAYNLITEVLNGYVIWPEKSNGFQLIIAFPTNT